MRALTYHGTRDVRVESVPDLLRILTVSEMVCQVGNV